MQQIISKKTVKALSLAIEPSLKEGYTIQEHNMAKSFLSHEPPEYYAILEKRTTELYHFKYNIQDTTVSCFSPYLDLNTVNNIVCDTYKKLRLYCTTYKGQSIINYYNSEEDRKKELVEILKVKKGIPFTEDMDQFTALPKRPKSYKLLAKKSPPSLLPHSTVPLKIRKILFLIKEGTVITKQQFDALRLCIHNMGKELSLNKEYNRTYSYYGKRVKRIKFYQITTKGSSIVKRIANHLGLDYNHISHPNHLNCCNHITIYFNCQ